jgi:NosR/NirI family nitrous oxide reductase transcriptional regulator
MRGPHKILVLIWLAIAAIFVAPIAFGEPLDRSEIEPFVVPPFSLGEAINDKGVYTLLNSGGAEAGFVFETEPLAPLPGFSGAPINILVMLDPDGRFLDVKLISHNEPIFVSGLGEAPFHKFFEQYRGLSISQSIVVGTPYGDGNAGSQLVYLDGVTKATASVRIAHESILGATLTVAREKMRGIKTGPPAYPDLAHEETLDWQKMLEEGLIARLQITNAEIQTLFENSIWEDDDPEAQSDPNGLYLDLYVADLGPPSIARALLSADTLEELDSFRAISTSDEPHLLIEAGRHGLVAEDFVRNTAPDLIGLSQDGLPIALRDADLYVTLGENVPGRLRQMPAMILRTDRRLGFDPTRAYELTIQAQRQHGIFQPKTETKQLELVHSTPDRFFKRDAAAKLSAPWVDALRNRATDLIILAATLIALVALMAGRLNKLAAHKHFRAIRLTILAAMLAFVGWYGQGQLSIVTVLATMRTLLDGGSFAYLLYDPFSLLIWLVVIISFVLWGRGFFCGWLCPFGALQEFADVIGRALKLPQIEPSPAWDARLKYLKYVVLAGMIATVLAVPSSIDKVAEVEPFKTAITVYFLREWYYVAYAVFWLLAGMVLFKGFCRYVCPLGAVMAIGGIFRGRDWIARREECGSPCQLCKVKCRYGSIKKTGEIAYSECFQCLDCVTIHDDAAQCVPLILAARSGQRGAKA